MQLSRYVKVFTSPKNAGYRLLYSTRKASAALISDTAFASLQNESLSDSLKKTLFTLGILVDNGDDEAREMGNFFHHLNERRSVFSATVVLNLDCNLACTYCYEEGIKKKRYLAKDAIEGFIDHVRKRDFRSIKEVVIDFYGGEPLLSTDLIVGISEELNRAAEELGFRYSFRLVTNGTLLTPATLEKLAARGLTGAKITLDGPEEWHNKTRPFLDGRGSFSHIVRNIARACDTIDIQIGGNYTIDTYRHFPGLLDDLSQRGITPDKVALVTFDPVAATAQGQGSPELSGGCRSITEEWLIEASIFLREEILRRGYRTAKITPLSCAVELENDMVLDVDGNVYKCPGMIGNASFIIGNIQGERADCRDAYGLDHWKTAACLECVYLPLCFGGCRLMNLLKNGSVARTDCRKAYLDATLESFIDQEIRYKGQIVGPGARHRKESPPPPRS